MMDLKFDKEKIVRLIISQLKNTITPEESIFLEEWVEYNDENKNLYNELCNESKVTEKLKIINNFNPQKDWLLIRGKLKNKKRKLIWSIIKYAALIIIIFANIAIIQYIINDIRSTDIKLVKNEIHPGSYKATLILPGGKEIELKEQKDSCITINNGPTLINNIISYNNNISPTNKNSKPEWHIIKIPRGGEYILKLCDSTKVWLNSETEIKYPSVFTGNERQIFLSGEAYFEVYKNAKKPFIVHTQNMDIRVLGTSFNVMAYRNEHLLRTTLVKGLVEVSAKNGSGEKIELLPGYQALIENGKIDVRKVNTKLFTSWKDSRFAFDNEPIESVLTKLSRWYDVEFFFMNEETKNKHFTGSIPKYENISNILNMLELTTNIKFKMKNKTIIIEKSKD